MISAKTVLQHLAISILLLIVLTITGIITFGYGIKRSLDFKNNPKDYAGIVAERREWPLYSFLPKTINAKAEKVAFFHQPGFLQGDDSKGRKFLQQTCQSFPPFPHTT